MSVQAASHPSGILAGGMADGTLNVWDAQRIIQSDGSDPLSFKQMDIILVL